MTHISSAGEILDRLREATKSVSDSELARLLGVSQQAVSSARKSRVPEAWVRIALFRYGISADWLFTGLGPMLFGGARAADPAPRAQLAGSSKDAIAGLERQIMEKEARILQLQAELEEARKTERAALLEANMALKRLVPHFLGSAD